MSLSVADIRLQIAQKPGRSAVLGCLMVTFAVLVIHALIKPRPAAALLQPNADAILTAKMQSPIDGMSSEELTQKIQSSARLWQVLHDVRGAPPAKVFRLATDYYQPVEDTPRAVDHVRAAPAPDKLQVQLVDPAAVADAKRQAIRRAAQKLELHSVVLAQDPIAVINSQMVRTGDVIDGFKIVAIQARQVVVEKDGTSVVLDMVP